MRFSTVREVAMHVCEANNMFCRSEEAKKLLSSIPEEILRAKFHEGNVYEITDKLDDIRRSKRNELAALLGLKPKAKRPATLDADLLDKVIGIPASESLDFRRKEFRFLLAVGCTLLHW